MLNYSVCVCVCVYTSAMSFLVGVQNSHRSPHWQFSVCPNHRQLPRQTPTVCLQSGQIGSVSTVFVGFSWILNRPSHGFIICGLPQIIVMGFLEYQ